MYIRTYVCAYVRTCVCLYTHTSLLLIKRILLSVKVTYVCVYVRAYVSLDKLHTYIYVSLINTIIDCFRLCLLITCIYAHSFDVGYHNRVLTASYPSVLTASYPSVRMCRDLLCFCRNLRTFSCRSVTVARRACSMATGEAAPPSSETAPPHIGLHPECMCVLSCTDAICGAALVPAFAMPETVLSVLSLAKTNN